jgi:hypothetical protein
VTGPPADSRMPTSSFRISEQRRIPPPWPPSKTIHAAREPAPSMPDIQAAVARSGSRRISGPASGRAPAPVASGSVTPAWAKR